MVSADWAEEMRLRAQRARRSTGMVLDEERILKLPGENLGPDDSLVVKWSNALAIPPAPFLFASQARFCESLSRAPERRGVVASVAVGEGKTLMALLAGTVLKANQKTKISKNEIRPLSCILEQLQEVRERSLIVQMQSEPRQLFQSGQKQRTQSKS